MASHTLQFKHMGNITKPNTASLPSVLHDDPWATAKDSQRDMANKRHAFIAPIQSLIEQGASQNNAINNHFARLEAGLLGESYELICNEVGKHGKLPSKPTVKRWLRDFGKMGKVGLLPAHTGRVRQDYGWEADAISLYNIPSKPSMADVAFRLRKMGFKTATNSLVRLFLNSLPADLGVNSPLRVGQHSYRLNRKRYIERDTSVLMVGEVYQGDGHTVDVYIAHPETGKPWRPELTAWIDVRSMYIVGWYLSESESSISTLLSLSHAMVSHDHVPAFLHIDNGSGFRSKMMSDESVGFYERFSVSTMFSIPGNPRGKGQIEHWFRTYRDRFDKFWNDGQDYCGHDMAEEINRRITIDINQGKRKLRSVYEYRDAIAEFIEQYNNEPQKNLNNQAPAELWATLERVPLEINADAVIRPSVTRVVRKQTITLHNRKYFHVNLTHYDGKQVVVEYSLHDDQSVHVHDQQGRLICIAELTHKVAYLPASRLDEARDKRTKGQLQRLQKRIDETKARGQVPIEADNLVDQLEQLESEPVLLKHDADDAFLADLLNDHPEDY